MVARKRRRKVAEPRDDLLERYGIEEITRENADEQFGKLLAALDRIDDTLFEMVALMRANRKKIDADLEQIGRNNDEIQAMIRGMRSNA